MTIIIALDNMYSYHFLSVHLYRPFIQITFCRLILMKEKFKDTNRVIISCDSKDRQCNDQQKSNSDLQNINNWATKTQ